MAFFQLTKEYLQIANTAHAQDSFAVEKSVNIRTSSGILEKFQVGSPLDQI